MAIPEVQRVQYFPAGHSLYKGWKAERGLDTKFVGFPSVRSAAGDQFRDWLFAEYGAVIKGQRRPYIEFCDERFLIFALKHGV